MLYAACKRGVRSPLRARSKQASSGYAAHCVSERKRAATIQRNFGRNTGSLRPWRTPAALKACKGRNRREKHRAWFVENYGARPDNLDEEQWVSQARKALWLLCRAAQSDAQGICDPMCNPWHRLMAAGRCLLASCCRLFFGAFGSLPGAVVHLSGGGVSKDGELSFRHAERSAAKSKDLPKGTEILNKMS